MTPQEHQLQIEMLKQQMMYYAGLVELLKSRGVIERGDLQAFDSLVSETNREPLERFVEESYLSNGRVLRVSGLPEY
jgi:hypothetical protein